MDNKNLAHALVNAQSQMGTAPMNGYNPHFRNKFSTLEDLIDASRSILTRNGLAITQYPDSDGNVNYLVTKLKHISGEEEVSRALIILKDPTDIQKLGSAISYMKRYAYAAICGIATSESDDDGHSITSPPSVSTEKSVAIQQAEPFSQGNVGVSIGFISAKQYGLLKGKIKESGRPEKELEICKKYNIPTLDKLPWKKMNEVLESLTIAKPSPNLLFESSFEEVGDLPF